MFRILRKMTIRLMLMQNFGRETRCIMGDGNMANISPAHCWPTPPNIAVQTKRCQNYSKILL